MSSHGFSSPIVIDNAVSPRLVGAAGAQAALAAGAVAWLPVPAAIRAALLLVLAAASYDVFRILLLRAGRRSLRRIELDGADRWRLTDARGRSFAAVLVRGARVSVPLVLLRWRDARGHRYSALLAADAVDRGALRRLRVRLRFGGGGDLLESSRRNWITNTANCRKLPRTFRSGTGL